MQVSLYSDMVFKCWAHYWNLCTAKSHNPSPLQTVLWRYKFSQLKGSSDDGKTRVKLLFKNADSKQIEMKVMHCFKLNLEASYSVAL